jgi:hypothetical protein
MDNVKKLTALNEIMGALDSAKKKLYHLEDYNIIDLVQAALDEVYEEKMEVDNGLQEEAVEEICKSLLPLPG